MITRYIDPTTDFGFKKLFGNKANKEITTSFLSDVLALETSLRDIHFEDKEQSPETRYDRAGIFDIYCTDDKGRHVLVEMQKSQVAYIQDRMVYYSTFPITKQAPKGNVLPLVAEPLQAPYGQKAMLKPKPWNFRLEAIYCIAVLGYPLEGSTTAVTCSSIRKDYPPHEVFYPKLKYITIELPRFDQTLPEYSLDIHLNKWLYFLCYLPSFDSVPEVFKGDPVFEQAFALAEYFNLTRAERDLYEGSLKKLWTAQAELSAAIDEAIEKIARALLQKGSAPALVAEVTGLALDKILKLQ